MGYCYGETSDEGGSQGFYIISAHSQSDSEFFRRALEADLREEVPHQESSAELKHSQWHSGCGVKCPGQESNATNVHWKFLTYWKIYKL